MQLPQLKARDYASEQLVRWCPGCGDYAILVAMQRACQVMQIPRENMTVISGIGCSSRFPYYMNTYGFHTIHGRAPGFVSGMKLANPEQSIWMVTGDGDALSIGGNHFMHLIRRNIDCNVMLFNNRIYGLTKGQYSPTSEQGKKTKSSPMGSVETPLNPLALALASGGTFVARSADKDRSLVDILVASEAHRGTSLIEIYQNCNIFNDGAFDLMTARETKDEHVIFVEHGEPLVFAGGDKGLARAENGGFKVIELVEGEDPIECGVVVHNKADKTHAIHLANMPFPEFPQPFGVLYQEEKDAYDSLALAQIEQAQARKGKGDLASLLTGKATWDVK